MLARRVARAIDQVIETRESLNGSAKFDDKAVLALVTDPEVPVSMVVDYLKSQGREVTYRITGFGDGEPENWEVQVHG